MNSAPLLRSLFFAAGLAFCACDAQADDIIANGNFSQGKAHWKGDGKDAGGTSIDDVSASMSNQGAVSGMVLTLKDGITYVSQVFHSGDTALTLSITYTTSADYKGVGMARDGRPGRPMPPGVTPPPDFRPMGPLETILGFKVDGMLPMPGGDKAVALIADPTQNAVIYGLFPLPASPGKANTTTVTLTGLMAHEEKTLYIFLPSGAGSITFSNIALTPPGSKPPSDNPFSQ